MVGEGKAASAGPGTEILKVFAVADRGMAMGHLRGKVAFVPLGAPGDTLEVEILREKKRHVEARLRRILVPSPLRRVPECPHFGVCGGCQWQHLSYAEQVAAKDRSFRGFLRTRLGLCEQDFRPPLPSPEEWGYRNRVGLKVRAVGRRVLLGFFAAGSHRLVPVDRCPIAHPVLQELLGPLAAFLQGFEPARGFVPQVDLQVDSAGRPWAVVHRLRPFTSEERRALSDFLDTQGVAGTQLQGGRKDTLTPLTGAPEKMSFRVSAGGRTLDLRVSPGGFTQANASINQALVDEATALADRYRGGHVLDLYCGAGNFTLPLALEAAAVVGVEGYPPAAADARDNAARHGFGHVRILAEPAERGLRFLAAEGFRPDFALLDPPREGGVEALGPLVALGPRHLAYVSCSPATLARDLGVLQGQGYRVQWVRTADMFPQTAHLESLTLLTRA